MRIDKFLKISRIIKRRSVANQACTSGAVKINDKAAKAGSKVAVGDVVEITLGERTRKFEILEIVDTVGKSEAASLYKEIS